MILASFKYGNQKIDSFGSTYDLLSKNVLVSCSILYAADSYWYLHHSKFYSDRGLNGNHLTKGISKIITI